jgi:hypothetical protein
MPMIAEAATVKSATSGLRFTAKASGKRRA